MAKAKTIANEREYIIPLRREILKVPKHKRTPKAVKAIKQFLAKHMRIPDRDVSKIKLDYYLNEELWHRGIKNPPTKIKVHVKRDGEFIRVSLVDLHEKINFRIANIEKKKKATEKTKKKEEKKPEKKDEEKKTEQEKKESSSEVKAAQAKSQAKEQKHVQSGKEQKTQPQRKALKK
jgi:large subunit ribosomal protein L31e